MNSFTTQNAVSGNDVQLSAELRKYLLTPFEDVYELSEDGLTYVKPASLRGVPVARAGEDTPYWQPSWASLDAYIAGEQDEEDLKHRAANMLKHGQYNGRGEKEMLLKEQKLHMDNGSKQKKIREVFGANERAHPNQLIAKRYLPSDGHGLCGAQETVYKMGCKITDLVFLANKGLLKMDPWDFYRWRVGNIVLDRLKGNVPGSKKVKVESIITKLGDKDDGPDPLFREAIVYSIGVLQGRSKSLGDRNKSSGSYKQAGKEIRSPSKNKTNSRPFKVEKRAPSLRQLSPRQQRLELPRRPRQSPAAPAGGGGGSAAAARGPVPGRNNDFAQQRRAEQEHIRAEQRAARAQARPQTTIWAGVNANRTQPGQANALATTGNGSGSEPARTGPDSARGQTRSSRFYGGPCGG